MFQQLLNPIRLIIESIGWLLTRLGLIDEGRAKRTADLAWPRVVTGVARMSKSTVDVAMVGAAVGTSAIAGVGFATPFWALAFIFGGGIAGGTISLVSQRYSAEQPKEISRAVKASAALAVAVTLPLVVLFRTIPEQAILLIGSGEQTVAYGAEYLRVVCLGMPFAAVNLVGSRALVGADDAWTPMVLRAGGAVVNITLNAVLIFAFNLGVVGAALGTATSNMAVTAIFIGGLLAGRLPLIGDLPIRVDSGAPHWHQGAARKLTGISTPLALTNLAQLGGQLPLLAIVSLFGPDIVAAFVIALRVRALMNTPGWGFGLASSSLVGQSLGLGKEQEAEAYGRDVLRFAVVVHAFVAVVIFVLAEPVSRQFVDDAAILPVTEALIRATCLSVVLWGTLTGTVGPLRASGDTNWPFYAQMIGLFVFAIPAAYLGAVTSIGVAGLYLSLILEKGVPTVITYYRFNSGAWKVVSRSYRPSAQG